MKKIIVAFTLLLPGMASASEQLQQELGKTNFFHPDVEKIITDYIVIKGSISICTTYKRRKADATSKTPKEDQYWLAPFFNTDFHIYQPEELPSSLFKTKKEGDLITIIHPDLIGEFICKQKDIKTYFIKEGFMITNQNFEDAFTQLIAKPESRYTRCSRCAIL